MDNHAQITPSTKEDTELQLLLSTLNHQLFVCVLFHFITLIFYVLQPSSHHNLLIITTALSVISIAVILLTKKLCLNLIKNKTFSPQSYFYFLSFWLGLSCSLSILFFQIDWLTVLSPSSLSVGFLMSILALHMFAMINWCVNYKIFLLFIFPTLLALFYTAFQLNNLSNHNLLITSLFVYAALTILLGYQSHKLYQKKISSIKKQLESDFDIQKKDLLQQNSYTWQKKIEQRTNELEKINTKLETSQHNLELAHETAGIASWDWNIENNSIHTSNFKNLFGYTIDQVDHYLKSLDHYIHPEDLEEFKHQIREHLNGKTERYESVFRARHATEGWIWVHDLGRVVKRHPDNKAPLRMVGIRRNIQTEKLHEEHLSFSNRVFKQLNQGFFVLDSKLTYTHVNPCFLRITGLSESQVLGHHIFDISKGHNPDLQKMHLNVLKHLMNHGCFEGEVVEEFQDGKITPVYMDVNAVYNAQNKITQYIGLATDLSERKSSEKRVSYLENYDALTDLPNRLYFNKILHDFVNQDPRFTSKFAVLRINLDRFRYYNELLNQVGGDELLKAVAIRLRRVSADATLTARLNSDDFAVIWEIKNTVNEVTAYCKRLIQAFDETFKINQQEFIMTLSIGIAFFPDHGRQIDSLNLHAELALLEAKRIGGNAVRIYRNEPTLSSEPRLKLESELRKAIQNNELILHYQPKLCGKTQKVYGFEALVRWNHPQHGILLPAQFIPLAEETSLISDIGRLVIEMACAQIKKWADIGFNTLSVSVNVVVQQLNRGNLLDEIDFNIKKYNINPQQLELEITETSLMENNENVRKVMDGLKERHIRVALDDFGIGYSSLAYLTHYPFDIIKIDRSFIAGIGNANKEAIVRAIIAMAKAMNKKLVAEGIETQSHYDFLINEECDYLQGYLIGKPMPADMATNMLKENDSLHFVNLSVPK